MMNENMSKLANEVGGTVEESIKATIEQCAKLIDSWGDSGRQSTFGDRLKDHFGIGK